MYDATNHPSNQSQVEPSLDFLAGAMAVEAVRSEDWTNVSLIGQLLGTGCGDQITKQDDRDRYGERTNHLRNSKSRSVWELGGDNVA